MGLTKQVKGKDSHTLVTFTIENYEISNSSQVLLLGDFNNWESNDSTYLMEKKGDSYVKSIKLENGKRYEFRYFNETNGWFNDNAADDYLPSPYEGIDNSVVDLTTPPPAKKKATKRIVKKTVKKTAKKTIKKDDLKKIEGIGPKIASILTDKGIGTFKKLGEAPIKTLENILKEAGSRYSMHKPNSWPKQATLASEGKWDELTKLQGKLKGGK